MKINVSEIVKTINIPWLRVSPDGNVNTVDWRNRTVFQFPAYANPKNTVYVNNRSVTGTYHFSIKNGTPIAEIPIPEIERLIQPGNLSFVPNNTDLGQIYGIGSIVTPGSNIGNWNEAYAFFTVEDAYEDGKFHHAGYQRIGMAKIHSPYSYLDDTEDPKIIGEHWQSEDFCRTPGSPYNRYTGWEVPGGIIQEPSGVTGIGSPNVFYREGEWYMVYQRLCDFRMMNWNPMYRDSDGYPPSIGSIGTNSLHTSGAGLCVAVSSDLQSWKKCYGLDFNSDFLGGFDTCLTDIDCFFPKIHWNEYLERYICVAQTSTQQSSRRREGILIVLSSSDLFDWRFEAELPIRDGYYPAFIDHETNSSSVIGERALLFYGRNNLYDVPRFSMAFVEVRFKK